jgi:hypothetical protein
MQPHAPGFVRFTHYTARITVPDAKTGELVTPRHGFECHNVLEKHVQLVKVTYDDVQLGKPRCIADG